MDASPKEDKRLPSEGKDKEMRRLTVLLATITMALSLITGVAIADTINCLAGRACVGTDGPDTLYGTSRSDYLKALQGNDELYGHEGYDVLDGDNFEAQDTSTDGNDHIGGGQNYDEMFGYGGNDKLLGRSGGDFIFAEESSKNKGEDVVRGNEGNDWILAKDGIKDTIVCGTGKYDAVFFDKRGIDTVSNSCEYKNPNWGGGSASAAASSGTPTRVSAKKLDALRAR
jgi:Ca2+-binding RTX toxin-like protein